MLKYNPVANPLSHILFIRIVYPSPNALRAFRGIDVLKIDNQIIEIDHPKFCDDYNIKTQ